MTLVSDLTENIDCILGIRDVLGAEIHKVFILKRTKSTIDPELGGFDNDATITDEVERSILPSPRIVDYSHSVRLKEGGAIKQGDLILKMISKNKFDKADIDCSLLSGEGENIERYYYINDELYNVIAITESHCWWNVQIRKVSDSEVYLD